MQTFWVGLGLLALTSLITLNYVWNRDLMVVSLYSKSLQPLLAVEYGASARNMVHFNTNIPPVFVKNLVDQDFIILISAFVDYRYQLFNSSGPLRVAINTMINKKRFLITRNKGLVCIFRVDTENVFKTFNSTASVKLSDDDHERPYNPAVVECILPEELRLTQEIQVSIGYKHKCKSLKDMSWLDLIFNLKSKSVATNTALVHSMNHSSVICVPPIRGDLYKETIVEWIEFYRILGVSHFLLYDYSTGAQTLEILRLYENKGIVSIIPWKIPSCEVLYPEEKNNNLSSTVSSCTDKNFWVHYFGQKGAFHDCLLRAVGYSRWIGFLDLDEYILSRTPNLFTLQELFQKKSSQLASISKSTEESLILSMPGFHFLNQFSFPKCKPSMHFEIFSKYDIPFERRKNLIGTSTFLFYNETSPAWSRNKVFINPLVIKRTGIHIPESIFDEVSFPSKTLIDENATDIFAKKNFLRYFIHLTTDEAVMLHIRRQMKEEPTCPLDLVYQTKNKLVNDSTMLDKYGDSLMFRVVNIYTQLNIKLI